MLCVSSAHRWHKGRAAAPPAPAPRVVPARRMLTASPSNGRWRSRVARTAGKPGEGRGSRSGPHASPLPARPPPPRPEPLPRPSPSSWPFPLPRPPPALRAPSPLPSLCQLPPPPSLPSLRPLGSRNPGARSARSNHGNHYAWPCAQGLVTILVNKAGERRLVAGFYLPAISLCAEYHRGAS